MITWAIASSLSLSVLAISVTCSLSAILTASGSRSAAADVDSSRAAREGDMFLLIGDEDRDLVRSGEPVRGMGEPLPSVVVVYVLSKPKE